MNADIVVDVGNSRIKWGRCLPGDGRARWESCPTITDSIALPHAHPEAWQAAFRPWNVQDGWTWIVAGVNPGERDVFMHWLREQRQAVHLLDAPAQLPLIVRLERPDHVGIDRLLNAVAANTRRPPGRPAVIVDAGSAITVDWLDEWGAFCGGAIAPGLRLMSEALHAYTALLPLVEIKTASPVVPAKSTRAAVEAGVFWSAAGSINTLVVRMAQQGRQAPVLFLAGGDARLLAPALEQEWILWPEITLEGIRLSALSW